MSSLIRKKELSCDVAVIGAGLAGICAAVAAARHGARTILINDRTVLGGNASSEIRVCVDGAAWLGPEHKLERETGIIEELLLHNRFNNPQGSYYQWDHNVYDFVNREDNIDILLNTQALEAIMDGARIKSARCRQHSSETDVILTARQFIDCSGDGLLAASAGAEFRYGREARNEFDEKYAPEKADNWIMGSSLLFSCRDTGRPSPYTPPSYMIPFKGDNANRDKDLIKRKDGNWWIEVADETDIIGNAEEVRHKLMAYVHGVWDYVKNSGKFPEVENLALDWIGNVPGRRESRRFIGDHILLEKDLTEYRHFNDTVAYGGWSIDEHCPGAIENLSEPPSYFHQFFDRVYEIPYRCLYSRNIENLSFAGRNISATHIAISSTRVMATCSVLGQAAGTAAAMCIEKKSDPRDIAKQHISELQERLLRDDAFIPERPANDAADLTRKADCITASDTCSGDIKLLTDGTSRDFAGVTHHWAAGAIPASIEINWEKEIDLCSVEIKCDTDVKQKIPHTEEESTCKYNKWDVPPEMLKAAELEVNIAGKWVKTCQIKDNKTRLIRMKFETIKTRAIRLTFKETYGSDIIKIFEIRCY